MIEHLPPWVDFLFILCVIYTLCMYFLSNGRPKKITLVLILWCVIQSVLAYNGFYHNTEAFPPRFILVILFPLILMYMGFKERRLDWFIAHRSLNISTFLHLVRLPIEICLLYLYYGKMIPELMTFEGRNFDILIGITALPIGLLFIYKKLPKKFLLFWNCIGLILVCVILANGLLSSELPFQQFGFEQPNVAINYFPYVLLPGLIVPIVIYTHLTDIVKLHRELND